MTLAPHAALRLRSHGPRAVWNALVSYRGSPIPLAGKGVSAQIEPTDDPKQARVAALVEADFLRAVVLFDAFPFANLFEANLQADDLEHLPPALRDILIEGMVSMLWSLIPQNRLARYSILGIGDWRDGAAQTGQALDWLAIAIQGVAPQPIRLRVGCIAVDVAQAIMGGQLAAQAAWSGLKAKLGVDAFVSLARMPLPHERARSLAVGDVFVLPAQESSRRIVRIGRELHKFQMTNDEWTYVGCESPPRRNEITQPIGVIAMDAEQAEPSAADIPALEGLMLDLDFDIAQMRAPLSTIETWQVGAVVELETPELTEGLLVTIRANGQAIAEGDLIQIDDRFAVRLTRLLVKA